MQLAKVRGVSTAYSGSYSMPGNGDSSAKHTPAPRQPDRSSRFVSRKHALANARYFDDHVDEIVLLISDVWRTRWCDLAIELQRQKRELRVLFVSGSAGSEFCRYYGVDLADLEFLLKPFRTTELALLVRQVLSGQLCSLEKSVWRSPRPHRHRELYSGFLISLFSESEAIPILPH